jgi:four helix bundle protein
MQDHRKLQVWQKAIELVESVYVLTGTFPKEEIYGLTAQMRRAAVSIPSNIAEGCRRDSPKEFRRFLLDAFGSGAELETQVVISKKVLSIEELIYSKTDGLLEEVMKMLNSIISSTNYKLQTTN